MFVSAMALACVFVVAVSYYIPYIPFTCVITVYMTSIVVYVHPYVRMQCECVIIVPCT